VFDPTTNTFAVGKPNVNLSGSPHEQLASAIGADRNRVVGGEFSRGPNGEIMTNEQSGHYWRNWTPEVRQQFVETMQQYGLQIIHR
jgi:hypothetical protein